MFTRRAQQRTSLLALFVLLWGLVFPALAQAGVGDAGAAWTEICTAQGIKKIQLDADDAQPAGHNAAAQHCVLCLGGAALAATDMPLLLGGITLQAPSLVFPRLNVALPEQLVLLSAPPRAPPFLFLR